MKYLNLNFNFSQKTKPYSHQIEAIEYVASNTNSALFDEQGLGKTKIVIDALIKNIRDNEIDGVLIVCKKSLLDNWRQEIIQHSFLKSIILRGTPNIKGQRYMGFSHFYLINYESVMSEVQRMINFMSIRKFAIVLDESHSIKNPKSKSAQALWTISKHAFKRIIISGTPIANKPYDLWSQFYFLDEGKLLGKDYSKFLTTYSLDVKDYTTIHEQKLHNLKDIINNNSIRRTKSEVLELPEKIFIDKYVRLSGKQNALYFTLKNELVIEVKNLDGEIILDESNEILKKLIRLVQIASNPYLIDKSYNETPAKFIILDEIVEKIIEDSEKAIIWSSFVENIKTLASRYKHLKAQMLYGNIPIEKRNFIINNFKNDPSFKILVANPAAAREGLTLTSANNAIYLDRNFNLVDYLQSQDRIHRISQTKKCKIIKLVGDETIDVFIDEILRRKKIIANYLQGDSDSLNLGDNITKEELLRYIE
jgi:SWI/SNF-related matrix-associated actin-dependent regulator of chromatin subfamily A-like protein 1